MNLKQSMGDSQWGTATGNWTVDDPALRQDPPCARDIGGFTFCYDINQGLSWAYANGIKCYNGCKRPYLTYNKDSHQWEFSTYAPESGTYVKDVLSQSIP